MEQVQTAKNRFSLRIPSFLKRWDSLFYYGVALFLIGVFWCIFALVMDNGAQTFNWDYTFQFVPLAYDFYDDWQTFFMTGKFPLYSYRVFLGTDNIGSNSYYCLLDPFMIPMILFPRSWIPQYMCFATIGKFIVTAFAMRAYLRIMKVSEIISRVGALAVAFSGYMNFMVGFPVWVSAIVYMPLVLFGLERIIQYQKPFWLIFAIFLEGISSFFALVTVCIFAVMYALWRFFVTVKTRNKSQNITVMLMGVLAFAIGLCLCAFSIIPSIRESMLTGRIASIGSAYKDAIITSIKAHDLRSFFALMFEEIGDHPGREIIALGSFFFPTGGFVAMPWARSGYDSWTASIFCYTPFIILFFTAILHSILQRKWHHLLAVFLCSFLFLTNFSHFFFYAFTGNGYGRWYFVLVPLIVYYGCWAFDQRKTSSRVIPLLGCLLSIAATLAVWFFIEHVLNGAKFTRVNGMTYWQESYQTAKDEYNGFKTVWFLYYQLGWMVLEGFLLLFGYRKKWLPHFLFMPLALEVIVMGNLVYVYNGIWWLNTSFAGGTYNRETTSQICDAILAKDNSFFRTYSDTFNSKYGSHVARMNGSSEFHSLMNFDVEYFALQNQIKYPGSTNASYETENIYNPSWSGAYMNKRFGTDFALGYRYYIIRNDYRAWKNYDPDHYFPVNVPFGAEEVEYASPDRDVYRIYRVKESYLPQLGYAVGDELYRLGKDPESHFKTGFYGNFGGYSAFRELLRNEEIQLRGAILEDDVEVPSTFVINEKAPTSLEAETKYGYKTLTVGSGMKASYYENKAGDGYFANVKEAYASEGPGYFINHHTKYDDSVSGRFVMKRDLGKVVLSPTSGEYFNQSKNGCYIELKTFPASYDNKEAEWNEAPRIYALGDSYDENGNLIRENDVLSYEFYSVDNMRKMDSSHSYYGTRNATFGLYCKGRVKYIAFCYKGSGNIGLRIANINACVQDYDDIMGKINAIQKGALQNVKRDVNSYSFETSYERERIVKTQLAYDAGWQAYANVPGKGKVTCQMLRLDGGLVGFVAPFAVDENGQALKVTYELVYATPFSKASTALWVVGALGFGGYALFSFLLTAKRRKKMLDLQG